MLKSTIRRLLERILGRLVIYIDNWQPRHVEDSSDAVRENIIKAHTLLSTLANRPDKRAERCYCDIETTLNLFSEFYETARTSDELLECSSKICALAQKSVDIINSIPEKTGKIRPQGYWPKRIIISVIVSFVMSVIVIPRLPFNQTEQNELLPTPLVTAQPEGTPVPTTPSDATTPQDTELDGEENGIAWNYRGKVHNGVPHGNGRMEYSNGSWFDGEWSHGRFLNGNGMEIFESGHFVGTFVNGFWSEGILQMLPSGAKYEGTFIHRNGLQHRHGNGRMDWPNGDWYEGGWRYDNRHGQGTMFHAATGNLQPGVWIDNILQ